MIWVRFLNGVARRVWLLAAFITISLAVVVSLGRQAIGELGQLRPEINRYLSDMLGVELRVGELSGDWEHLTPRIKAADIEVYSDALQDVPAITFDKITAEPDLINSLLSREFVWRELTLGQVALTLEESAEGGWSIAGLPLGEGDGSYTELMDALFLSAHVQIQQISLTLNFYSGTQATLYGRDILVENTDLFHRLSAAVAQDDGEEAARLIFEASGDHRDPSSFDGSGYLKLNRINFRGSLNALAHGWFPVLVERIGEIETDIDGEFWFDSIKQGKSSFVGYLSAAEVPLNWLEDAAPLTNLHANITGWFQPGNDWGIRLQGLDSEWGELDFEPLDIIYQQHVGASWGSGNLSLSQLNVSLLDKVITEAGLAPEPVLKALKNLQPTGSLRSVHLAVELSEDVPKVNVRGNLDDISIASWGGGPASQHIDGYFSVEVDRDAWGILELDSQNGFAMRYPQVYDGYMKHGSAKGQLRWRWSPELAAVRVSSGPIDVLGPDGDGRVYIYLDLPVGQAGKSGQMYLQIGMRNSHSRYAGNFIPKNLSPELLNWLDEAVGDADVPEVGFIWRGPFRGAADERSIQLYLNVKNSHLKFQPDWPALTEFDAVVTLDGTELDGELSSGRIGDAALTAGIQLRPAANDKGLLLRVTGEASAAAAAAVEILADSPLSSHVEWLEGWTLSGESRVQLDLVVPLGGATGESYLVDAQLEDVRLAQREGDIAIEQATGKLSYQHGKGLFSGPIKGALWGQPINLKIATAANDISIDLQGRIGMDALSRYVSVPEGALLTGRSEYSGELRVPLAEGPDGAQLAPVLHLTSNLKGSTVKLPHPFAKAVADKLPVDLSISLDGESQQIDVRLGDLATSSFKVLNGAVEQGVLVLNGSDTEVSAAELEQLPKRFLVKGSLDELKVDDWEAVYHRLVGGRERVLTLDEDSLQPMLDLQLGKLVVSSLSLSDIAIEAQYADQSWQVNFQNDMAAGELEIADTNGMLAESEPIKVSLDYLHLPEGEVGTLTDVDPTTLPEIDLSVADFSIGESHYGEASFAMRSVTDGVQIGNIQGDIRGMLLGSKAADKATSLVWTYTDKQHSSRFEGVMQSEDIGDVLAAWQLPKILDSERALFQADLTWSGKPWDISSESLYGYLALEMEDGHFYKSPKGAANALIRTVGLFNFANWVRRLKLDFSDLFEKGMSFDEVSGGLLFDRGVMTFDAPIEVKMPSGRMRMSGSADLLNEQIDAHLVTTLPVGTNLPWLAAIAGGLPAAAGVYLTSKIFEKQVDKLSSMSYHVAGSWDDPDIELDRIFSDSTSKKPANGPAEEKGRLENKTVSPAVETEVPAAEPVDTTPEKVSSEDDGD